MQNNLENALVILLVMSVVKETSVMGDKEDHFFLKYKVWSKNIILGI